MTNLKIALRKTNKQTTRVKRDNYAGIQTAFDTAAQLPNVAWLTSHYLETAPPKRIATIIIINNNIAQQRQSAAA